MWIYIALALYIYYSAVFSRKNVVWNLRERSFDLSANGLFAVLLLLAAFRAKSVGADTKNYINIFNYIAKTDNVNDLIKYADKNYIEYGYLFYNKLISCISKSEQTITFFNSILLFLPLGILLKNTSHRKETVFLFYCLGVYQTALNLLPSSAASLIAFCAIPSINEKKRMRTLLIFVIAFVIHQSCFVFVALYFLDRIKITKRLSIIVFLCGFAVFLFYPVLLPLIMRFVPYVYRYYFNSSMLSNGIVFVLHIIIFAFIIIAVDFENTDRRFNVLMWAFLLDLTFYWLGLRMIFFSRISLLFTPCLILLIPLCLRNMKVIHLSGKFRAAFYGIVLMQYILRLQVNNIGTTMPYKLFWG